MFKKNIGFLVVVMFGAILNASAPKPWINLDDLPEEVRISTLREKIFISPAHFPPLYQAAKDFQDLVNFYIERKRSVDEDYLEDDRVIMGFAGGTLGIARFGECLPWDDDIDYAMDVSYEDMLREMVPLADRLGYNLFADELVGWKFYRKEKFVDPETSESHHIFIDVFLFKPEADRYVLERERGRQFFTKAWFTKQEFETRTVLKCGPLMMPCSTYLIDVLHRHYSADCITKALYYFSHIQAVTTCYSWTIRETDGYPSCKDLVLENRVKEILGD